MWTEQRRRQGFSSTNSDTVANATNSPFFYVSRSDDVSDMLTMDISFENVTPRIFVCEENEMSAIPKCEWKWDMDREAENF